MGTQQQRVLKALENGGMLSSRVAWDKYGIARLSARISELRSMGYPIESFRRETVNKFGESTHYYDYYLRGQKDELQEDKSATASN